MNDYLLMALVFLLIAFAATLGFQFGYWIGRDAGLLEAERRWWRQKEIS